MASKITDETIEYVGILAKLKLSGEEKKKFLNFVNATSVVNGETALDSFIVGFRLGAAFTLDTFVSNDTPFTNLLKEDI